jgi:hypothetical protein
MPASTVIAVDEVLDAGVGWVVSVNLLRVSID